MYARSRDMTLRIALVVCSLALIAGSTALEAQRETGASPRLSEWLKAVADHEPGTADVPARTIADWSGRDLRVVTGNLRELRSKPDPNGLVKRAAVLHTDIAMLLEPSSTRSDRSAAQTVIRAVDGRLDSLGSLGVHWELARRLVERVDPDPSRDDWVRLWYLSTAAYMASHRELAMAAIHLDRARRLFPTDPLIAFASGCQHESLAAPDVQVAAQSQALTGLTSGIGSAAKNREQATTFFRRTLEIDPAFIEARIHLGRVLSLRAHHSEGVSELRRAVASTEDRLLEYYAQLFLADAEQALGHYDEARESALRAATLYPGAQSPHLALSLLARRRGDRDGAQRAIESVLKLPHVNSRRDDPWWVYNVSHARNAATLLVDMYKPFVAERRRGAPAEGRR